MYLIWESTNRQVSGFRKNAFTFVVGLVNSIFTAHEKPLALRVEYV